MSETMEQIYYILGYNEYLGENARWTHGCADREIFYRWESEQIPTCLAIKAFIKNNCDVSPDLLAESIDIKEFENWLHSLGYFRNIEEQVMYGHQ